MSDSRQQSPTEIAADIFQKILAGPAPGDLDDLLRGLDKLTPPGVASAAGLPSRINADPHNVERGLAQLALTIIELLRQLMERQAIRRMEAGTLTDDEVERLGQTFMKLEQRMEELKKSFGLEGKDLNLDLGPLGKLM
jgi:hypothetical protein